MLGFVFPSFGPLELGIILIVALLLFGRKLPQTMRAMGSSVVEFKKGLREVEDDMTCDLDKESK